MAKIIKRYGNRKLYDMEASAYVTLKEIAEMVKRGEEVSVIENRTGEDLTKVTLTQIILEEEKQKKSILPLSFLRRIIQQSGEAIEDLVQKVSAQSAATSLRQAVEDTERGIIKFLEKGEEKIEEGREKVVELFKGSGRGMEEIQKSIDDRIRLAMEKLPGVGQLYAQVKELEKKIDVLEGELANKERELRRRSRRGRKPHAAQPAAAAPPTPSKP